jgi:hypothetical protein
VLERGRINPPLVRHVGAAASARSKDLLTGGKQIQFSGSRKGVAVVLVFLLLALGYGGVVSVHYFMEYLEWVSHKKQEKLTKRISNPGAKDKKVPVPKPAIAELPQSAGPEEPPTVGDKPRRIGNLEVRVILARVGIFDQAQTEQRLAIRLEMRNHSQRQMRYRPWSDPANKAVLRDGTPSGNKYAPIGPGEQPERTIEAGATIEDIVSFPPPPPLYGVDLVLPLGAGFERFHFTLPREFIGRSE